MIDFNSYNIYFDDNTTTEDNSETHTENTSEGLSEDVPSIVPEAYMFEGYDYQYSPIEFLAPYDAENDQYTPVLLDNRPYMSSEVTDASLNDIYTMVLSIRNVVMLWFLIWFLLKLKTMLHNIVMKYMEGRL